MMFRTEMINGLIRVNEEYVVRYEPRICIYEPTKPARFLRINLSVLLYIQSKRKLFHSLGCEVFYLTK